MKVVFFEDVAGTAEIGDVKDVKNGFARNFLLPRGVAGPATKDNLFRAQAMAERENRRQAKLDEEWSPVAARLTDYTFSFEARVGETGRLYGSVTNREIAERLTEYTGQEIDSRIVLLPEPLRDLGMFPVPVRLTRNLSVEVNVEVVPDEESKPIVAKLEAERAAQEEIERKEAEAAAYQARLRGEANDDTGDADDTAAAEDDGDEAAEEAIAESETDTVDDDTDGGETAEDDESED